MERQTNREAPLFFTLEAMRHMYERSQLECSFLRRRLQEEQEMFRERLDALERATQVALSRLNEEKEISHQLRTQLEATRQELRDKANDCGQRPAAAATEHKVVPDSNTDDGVLEDPDENIDDEEPEEPMKNIEAEKPEEPEEPEERMKNMEDEVLVKSPRLYYGYDDDSSET